LVWVPERPAPAYAAFVLLAGCSIAFRGYRELFDPRGGALLFALAAGALALAAFSVAALYALPADRRRAKVGLRIVANLLTLVALALFLAHFITDRDPITLTSTLWVVIVGQMLILVLVFAYLDHRRRSRRH
jgi:drug/metabolite transporter (DMT)-like permease